MRGLPDAVEVRRRAIGSGGRGLQAAVLDAAGTMRNERVRMDTTYPCPP